MRSRNGPLGVRGHSGYIALACGVALHRDVSTPCGIFLAVIETFDGPAFRSPAEVRSAPYRREPYVRATLPDGSTVDAKVVRWSPSHALIHWQDDPAGPHREAWVPGAWCERIDREDSAWRDPYDLH